MVVLHSKQDQLCDNNCILSTDKQHPNTAVTFTSDNGYLLSQAWVSGTITVSFRTHHSSAILLYQNGTDTNINYFIVALTTGKSSFSCLISC